MLIGKYLQQKKRSTVYGALYFPVAIIVCIVIITSACHIVTEEHKDNLIEEQIVPDVYLALEDRTGTLLYERKMVVGETFFIEYIHSITRQIVTEHFRVGDDYMLYLEEMHYNEFGANLPVGPEYIDGHWSEFIVLDDGYIVKYQERAFAEIPQLVGQVVADHRLVFANGTDRVHLEDVLHEGRFVKIKIVTRR